MNQQKTHLIPLLQQELEVGQRLLDALNNEFHCLQQRDPKAIEQAVASKQICVAEFEGIDHQRQQLASQGDIPAQSPTHAPQTDDPQLKKLLQKLQTLATECHQQNLVNGGITELGRQQSALPQYPAWPRRSGFSIRSSRRKTEPNRRSTIGNRIVQRIHHGFRTKTAIQS
jgi:flagellar biosynthesis/type III secretory pathway chaperone